MKLSSITGSAIGRPNDVSLGNLTAAVAKPPEEPMGPRDGILISGASTALNQLSLNGSTKIEKVAAAVQGGTYQDNSAATSNAIVRDALSGGN
jgi:hypothetical protein